MKRFTLGLGLACCLCRLASADAPAELKGHTALVYSVAFSPDGKLLTTAGFDNVVKLWDTENLKEVRSWDFKMPAAPVIATPGGEGVRPFINSMVFSHDGKAIITANANGALYVLDVP